MASTSTSQDPGTVLTSTSTPTSIPTSPQIITQIPNVDLTALAKTTRKSLDRLASFSNMQSATDPLPILTKISAKIHALIRLIDASMLAAQLGYQLATDAISLCESTLIVVDSELGEWDAGVSIDIEVLRETCRSGCENAVKVMEGFRDVRQEAYKIAAATKDNMFVVLVPPDKDHAEKMKIHLKDIGTGLVANLNLLSDFARAVMSVSDWWTFMQADLESTKPTTIPSPNAISAYTQEEVRTMQTRWFALKEGFQKYYDIISVAQGRYPDLLPSSSTAWKEVTTARRHAPSSLGHGEEGSKPHHTRSPTRVPTNVIAKGMQAMFNKVIRPKLRKPDAVSKSISKGKEKDKGSSPMSPMSRSNSAHPSISFYHSGTPSTISRSSSLSIRGRRQNNERKWTESGLPRTRRTTLLSCCSVKLFGEDEVSRLGSHVGGFMIR
ncbi:hypothetical protein JR316_0012987 [Psilocybe cubensis]|uniref:Uncharacterized protein n=1 Tax=Psilocybe cubensis TaxID=181762 RepID=A0ACB8GG51_PSICU|nr:hypothetical protein JR316_0012987 [Psilocybe cubensis]KAH9474526.1 hypothetical protein JR316_0012987 [Psilocybe cubensis]